MKLIDLNRDSGIGANSLFIQLGDLNILIDCGLHPKRVGRAATPDLTPLRGITLDLIIITHCHLDHIGSLPVVMREHPNTPVIMTLSSRMLIERMLHNSANVMVRQKEEANIPEYPLFTHDDIDRCAKRLTGLPFEAALDIDSADAADRNALDAQGWRLVDPAVAADPDGFRDYVRASGAEFSVAQGIYVETLSGWFSDRSVRYLASGRPVLVQDTGFGRKLPVGEGLLAFRTLAEAVEGARAIVDDYDRHARTARAIAEEHFDSNKVLGALLEDAL